MENQTPAVVTSVEAALVGNAMLLDYLTSEVALEEPEIVSTDQNFPIDNTCPDDSLHFGMPGGSGDYEDEGDEGDEHDAITTTSRRRRPTSEHERFDVGTDDTTRYEGNDADDADAKADEQEEASQANDGSTQNVVD